LEFYVVFYFFPRRASSSNRSMLKGQAVFGVVSLMPQT
jgi:hypothetical protein